MKKFSIYKIISILAFIALFFILSLPNFFNINKKQESEQCIKNMRAVYNGALDYMRAEGKDFQGTSSDLERLGYLNKAYECPSEGPGDKYQVTINNEEQTVSVRCINEINSSPYLTRSSFEDFIYFVNIVKFHQKPTSEFIYDNLTPDTKSLLDAHVAYSDSKFEIRTWQDWDKFIANVNKRQNDETIKEIWSLLPESTKDIFTKWHRVENPLTYEQREEIASGFNTILVNHEFSEKVITSIALDKEAKELYKRGYADLKQIEKQRLNRIILESMFPYEFQIGLKYNIPTDALANALVDDINEMLRTNVFNDPLFIENVELEGKTIKQMETAANNEPSIALTNRFILHDAYPTLIANYADMYSDHHLPEM